MSFRKKAKKMKGDLTKRHQEQSNRKSDSGRYGSIFLKDELPEGLAFYKITEDQHEIDIIPFFAGSQHPHVDEGQLAYVVDVWVHQNVGAMNDSFVCPAVNFRKPCPICEWMNQQGRLPKEEWNDIRPKRRTVYLIWAHGPKEEEKGIQVLEVAHFFLEEKLDEISKKPRGGGYIPFSDPDEGRTIVFSRKGTGATNTQYLGHRFIDREDAIPDDILDQSFALDNILNMHPDPEEIKAAFHGSEEEKVPTGTGEDVPIDQDETPEDEPENELDLENIDEDCKECFQKKHGEYEDCEECKYAEACKSEEEEPEEETPEEETPEEETPEEETPEDELDLENIDEAEEACFQQEYGAYADCEKCKYAKPCETPPASEKKKEKGKASKKSTGKCKFGYEFGVDLDEHDECTEGCKQWDECADKNEELDNE